LSAASPHRADSGWGREVRLPPLARVALLVLALLGLGFVAAYHRQAVVLEVESMPRRAYREGYMLPDAQALRLIALGHSEVAADLVWIRALSYFAVHFGLDRDYRWLESYIETIIALDPNFRMIYQWAGVVTMYGGQRIDNAAVEASNRFLLAGHERYPDEWIYPFMLGCNYRFELRPETEEQAAEWRIQGAQYLRRAAALPEAPSWLSSTASAILGRYGEYEEAIRIDAEAFLTGRVLRTATLDAGNALSEMAPEYGALLPEFRDVVGRGVRLQRAVPPATWAEMLHAARMNVADAQGDAGFLRWELRLFTFGAAAERVGEIPRTPLDDVFSLTSSALAATP
jgi:hypothetical protein